MLAASLWGDHTVKRLAAVLALIANLLPQYAFAENTSTSPNASGLRKGRYRVGRERKCLHRQFDRRLSVNP